VVQNVRTGIIILAAIATAPAMAGLFNSTLTPAESQKIQHLAVVSILGETLHGRQIGLTVFGNKGFDEQVLNWGLDGDARSHLLEKIVASKKFAGSIEPLVVVADDQKAILALAREGNFDAVIAVLPVDNPHDRLLPAGPGIIRKKALGIDHLRACDSMIIRIWRVADGKQLGSGFAYPCAVAPVAGVWHDKWSDFTEEEKRSTLESIRSFVIGQIDRALIDLKILQP